MITEPERIQNLRRRLDHLPCRCRLAYFPVTGSTNDEAKKDTDTELPCLYLTEEQTAGRGRFLRPWKSEKGASVTFSLKIRPECRTEEIPALTELFALAVCGVLRRYGISAAQIKWPNDVIAGGRKICGILTEACPGFSGIVIGAGINLKKNAYPAELSYRAVSLEELLDSPAAPEELVFAVAEDFCSRLSRYNREGMAAFLDEYNSCLANIGKDSAIRSSGKTVAGKAEGIDEKGRLRFRTETGDLLRIHSGEVSVSGIYNGE